LIQPIWITRREPSFRPFPTDPIEHPAGDAMVILYFFGVILGLFSRRLSASIPLAVALSAMPAGGAVLQFAFC
jgi:hypothetical protein